MSNFSNILEQKVDSIERPPLLPMGTYMGIITKHEFGKSKEKQTPFVEFYVRLQAGLEDVDPAALAQIKELGKRELRVTHYLTEDAAYRLRDFLEKTLRINCTGRTLRETIPEANTKALKVHIKHVPSNKPGSDEVYANIDAVAPAE